MAKRKPARLEVGNAYRLYAPFSQRPSDQIAVVTAIRQPTKNSRQVEFEVLHGRQMFRLDSYTEFLRKVHSEAPAALN